MSADDDLASVRVEVGGGMGATPDAPNVSPRSSGGGPKWVLALAVIALGAIVATILALRPSEDEAADGSERSVPTTTVPDETDEDTDEPETDSETDESVEADSNEIIPTLVSSDSGISQIVPVGVGFIGFVEGESDRPQILRSLDGLDWFDIQTTASTLEGPNTDQLNWFRLLEFGDSLMLTAFNFANGTVPTTRAFVSETGSEWVEFDLPSSGDPSFFLINGSSTSFLGLNFQSTVVENFVVEHTTLDAPEDGVCGVSPQVFDVDGQPRAFDVFDCAGEIVAVLDEAAVREPFVTDDVLACAEVINGLSNTADGFEFGRLDLTGDFTTFGLVQPFDLPIDLADGGVALVDFGTFAFGDFGPCTGFVDEVEQRAPAIVVADDVSSEASRFALPTERSPFPGESFMPLEETVNIVGEVEVGERRHLIVVVDGALLSLDLETGFWSEPLTSPETPLPDAGDQRFALSESGSRAFTIADSLLITFDFDENEDGDLEVVETVRPISLTNGPGTGVNFTRSLYATDKLLFITDGGRTWVLETPPAPGQ